MADKESGNIVTELRKRGKFGALSEERMKQLLELTWNRVEYALKDSQKEAGQLEECYDSKGMQSLLNGRTFIYHCWGSRFNMLSQSYNSSQGLCSNN